jgi:enediyne biosynthesis protein E4
MKQLLIIITIVIFLYSCNEKQTLFKEVKSTYSNIHFNNEIKENDKLNVVNYEYLYNGGGVGIGDYNNDSLPDIYFTGNLVPQQGQHEI